jgi:hypothetical protein
MNNEFNEDLNTPVDTTTAVEPETNKQGDDLEFIEDAPMITGPSTAPEVEGPSVDPTGTFTDWDKFKQSGFGTIGHGEKESDYIPLPKTDAEGFKILQPNPQVQIRRPMYGNKDPRKDVMPMFNFVGTEVEMFGALVQYDIASQRKKREYTSDHSEALDQCAGAMVPDTYLWRSQWRPGARWTNVPTLGGKQLHMGPARDASFIGSIQSSVGDHRLGVNNMVPMWHSGFHVRLKTPTGRQIAELDAAIASEKNVFGRRTGGALFSNTRCYLESSVLDLFIDCLETTNITNWTPEMVRRLLDGRDIQVAALALQAAKYPSNYPAVEPCVEAEAGCTNIKETSFTPMNSLVTDEARFTDLEIRFLNERFVQRTEKDVIEFQKSASWNQMKTVRLTDTLEFRLKHPKATETIDSGYVWAGAITAAVHRVLGDDSPSRNRANFMSNLIDSEGLRRFVAYIDGVIQDGEEKEHDETSLLNLLEHIGDDQQLIRRFELDIRDFEDQDIIAYMATPRYHCADCERKLAAKDPERLEAYNKNPILVPQDAVSRFFMSRRL